MTYRSALARLFGGGILASIFVASPAGALVFTYSDEAAFIDDNAYVGPLDAPFTGATASVAIGGGRFFITPGPGVPAIAVANVVDTTLPTDLVVVGSSPSDLNFAFAGEITDFGFTIANATGAGFAGTSQFSVTLLRGGSEVDTAVFETPGTGERFLGLRSGQYFDGLLLREVAGGPQNESANGGFADREFFGRFYVPNLTPVPEPSGFAMLALGLGALAVAVRRRRRA